LDTLDGSLAVVSNTKASIPGGLYLLPAVLAALAALGFCWYCVNHHAPHIQSDILSRTRGVLASAGVSTAGLSVDGRKVLLKGFTGSPEISLETQERARAIWGVESVVVEEITRPPAAAGQAEAAAVQTKVNEIIRLKNIEFLTGSSQLTAESARTLDQVAEALGKSPALTISISGHTDSQGNAVANQALSEARANSVKSYLATKSVAGNRMTAAGFGQTKPIAGNATPEGRSRNRRIEFAVTGGGQAEVLPAR
jgi:outer membrane protein OmpA-like peptidoglycan-associated protein